MGENVEKLVQDYRKQPTSRIFEEIWQETVGMVNPSKYFDPTHARTIDDFNQVTREALFKALQTYNPQKGSTALSWIRMKMSQFLVKELKKITRDSRVNQGAIELNATYDNGQEYSTQLVNIEKELHGSSANFSLQPDGVEITPELVDKILRDVKSKLAYNVLILQVFNLIVVFPNISRQSLHLIVGVSKATLSKYFIEIKKECIKSFHQHYI